MDIPNFKLTNVHEVLSLAAAEPRVEKFEEEISVQTFKMKTTMKDQTDEICKINGTTTSKFLRKCCECLVQDYTKA